MAPKLYRPRLLELVEVAWSDARVDLDYDGPPEVAGGTLAALFNCGYYVGMNRERVQLASCRDAVDGTVRHIINIPRNNVRSIRSLEPKEEPSGPQQPRREAVSQAES